METTFYDDSQFRSGKGDIKIMKRPMTLDLDSPGLTKKQKFALLTSPDLNMLKLASPELERFIIAQNGLVTTTPTPTQFLFPKNVTEEQEQYARGFVDALEQLHKTSIDFNNGSFILPHNGDSSSLNCVTTSASILSPATLSRLYSGTLPVQLSPSTIAATTVPTVNYPQVTSTTGTIKSTRPASVESANSNNSFSSVNYASIPSVTSLPLVTSSSTTSISAVRPASVESTSSNSYPGVSYISVPPNVTIKEEPQTVPSRGTTPPLSPIDMEDQERIKLERKRLRNRIAASKCRRRKLERISRLEDKVKILKGENAELGSVANKLREQVCQLKQQVLDHVKSGCQIMVTNNF